MADTKADKAEAAEQAKEVKKAHAATGRPVSPTDDPTDHSTTASDIAGQTDPGKKSGATAQAAGLDKMAAKSKEKEEAEAEAAEEDNTIAGKLARSGLYFVRNHATGEDYVGESPQNDPDASDAAKLRSTVMPLTVHAPRTGMQIRIKGGESFSVPDGFGPDAIPADWAKVLTPSGAPMFP